MKTKEEIYKELLEGKTYLLIAREEGTSPTTIRRLFTEEEREEIKTAKLKRSAVKERERITERKRKRVFIPKSPEPPFIPFTKEERKEHRKQYRDTHIKEAARASKKRYESNKTKLCAQVKVYRQTSAGKETNLRKNGKRRKLGFIPLNTSFEGSNGHHLNTELVVYIPKELHKKVYHNVRTGKGMLNINDLALTFFQPLLTGVLF